MHGLARNCLACLQRAIALGQGSTHSCTCCVHLFLFFFLFFVCFSFLSSFSERVQNTAWRLSDMTVCMFCFHTQQIGPFVWSTYEEVNRRINSLAAGLTKLGLAPGTHLGFYSRTRAEWQLLEHACYRRNMTSIALYDTLGPDAVEYIVNHAVAFSLHLYVCVCVFSLLVAERHCCARRSRLLAKG